VRGRYKHRQKHIGGEQMGSRSCGDDQVAVVAIKSRLSGGGRRGQQLALARSSCRCECVCAPWQS
jgi:hypothetical protein